MKPKTQKQTKNLRRKQRSVQSLPTIPDKRYFTIGETAFLCSVKPHVLRYWEQEFSQLRPLKRRGNRRYYQHNDILLVREIRKLLYEQGFTIEGARSQLLEASYVNKKIKTDAEVKKMIADLEGVLQKLKTQEIIG